MKNIFFTIILIGFIVCSCTRSEPKKWSYEILEDDSIMITHYLGQDYVVEIPIEIDGKTVSHIGDSITPIGINSSALIIIPEGIQKIQNMAFKKGILESIDIPNSVVEIGSYAFDENPLSHIHISNENIIIGENAFGDLTRLILANEKQQGYYSKISENWYFYDGYGHILLSEVVINEAKNEYSLQNLAVLYKGSYNDEIKIDSINGSENAIILYEDNINYYLSGGRYNINVHIYKEEYAPFSNYKEKIITSSDTERLEYDFLPGIRYGIGYKTTNTSYGNSYPSPPTRPGIPKSEIINRSEIDFYVYKLK
jgi:hypothetical protein